MKILFPMILVSVLLMGCQTRQNIDVQFFDTIEAGEFIDSCDFIKTVNDEKVDRSKIIDRNLLMQDIKIICPVIENASVGEFNIVYDVNGRKINHVISIVDTTAPDVVIDEEYLVEEGNTYFDLISLIKATDNLSEVTIDVRGSFDVNSVGLYTVIVSVKDSSGNKVEKEVLINVVEKEKEIIEVIVQKPPTSNGSGSGSSNNTGSTNTGSSNSSNNVGNTGGNSSGQITPESNNVTPTPFLSGVKNMSISVNSSVGDLAFKLQNGVTASSSISIDYGSVNLSVPGSYTVYYYTDDGQSATCKVEVVE